LKSYGGLKKDGGRTCTLVENSQKSHQGFQKMIARDV